jgi:glycosyltransferase involved in cell wall biosynthesis
LPDSIAQTQTGLNPLRGEKLLLLLPQIPHDPASGAARTMALIATLLGESGFAVRAVGTTASEGGGNYEPMELLRAQGAEVRGREGFVEYDLRGLHSVLLDVGTSDPKSWRQSRVAAFDRLVKSVVSEFDPAVVLTYGGHPDDVARVKRLRADGRAVVLGLWNLGYLRAPREFFAGYDAIVGPSQYLADVYRVHGGIDLIPLTTPIFAEDVCADQHEPVFFTAVNPSWEKGLGLLVRLAEMLGTHRRDIPMLFVESRGTAGQMVAVAGAAGIDLKRHANLMFTPSVAKASEFLKVTRATIIPSFVSEGSGRVASESMVAGIPPLVSDRGGLPAEAGSGGFVLPLPDEAVPEARTIVDERVARPWFELIERLADDEKFYAEACARAKTEGARFLPETLRPIYAAIFRRLIRS